MNTENHYQETDLGNISLNPRGEYNPEESYEYLDLVVLKGGSYVCLAENGATITGISPESGKTTQYWQVITIPGSLTPEYIAMHDRVVNLSEQVGADAVEVRTAEQNVSGMELNVTQMQEQTRQSAEAAEQSKDSSAGYAASADASRQAAEESKQNIDVQVTGFDSHVAEKTEEAENDIEAARIAANKAIIAQQEQSVNEVARAGIEAISTAQSAAQTATEKAHAAATSEKNAAASETAAKLSEANATKMAEQVAADKEQVAYDRTAVENAKQEMTGSVAQIDKNTQGIAELKSEVVDKIDSVDTRINAAMQWYDVQQPTKKLTGRINVFENVTKGIMKITSDVSQQTIVVHGVNYFDKNDLIPGGINTTTGDIVEITGGYATKHLIPVHPGKKLFWNRSNVDGVRSYLIFHFYGQNQEWLRQKVVGSNTPSNIFIPEDDVYFIRVQCKNFVDADAEKLCVADVDIGTTLYGGYDGNWAIAGTNEKTYFGKNVYFPYVGYRIENGVLVGASNTYTVEEITHVDVFEADSTIEVNAPVEAFDQERLRNVVLKYGRYAGTDYVMARIFKNTITGDNITPRVLAFTPGGKTVADLAKENDFVFAINAGIFNTDDNSCLGTTISNGVVITDHVTPNLSGAGDTLGVDSNGDFVSIAYDTTTQDMLANGIIQTVQGWATIISNYAKSDLDALKETLYPSDGAYGTDYIVTAKHPRTACGQYANGDYMVFLCGGRQTNQAGMTLAEMQELFVDEGVKFAYNLDGGGSCNGYFYKRETAPYTENRACPSYIVFD